MTIGTDTIIAITSAGQWRALTLKAFHLKVQLLSDATQAEALRAGLGRIRELDNFGVVNGRAEAEFLVTDGQHRPLLVGEPFVAIPLPLAHSQRHGLLAALSCLDELPHFRSEPYVSRICRVSRECEAARLAALLRHRETVGMKPAVVST